MERIQPQLTLTFLATVFMLLAGCASTQSAVQHGDVNAVRLALDGGQSPNLTDIQGRPLLTVAAENGQLAVVQELIRRGAVLDRRDPRGMTPLFVAVANNHLPVVQELLAAGADIELRHLDAQLTPLALAVERGYKPLLEVLLLKGAQPDVILAGGQTPLSHLLRLRPSGSQSDLAGTRDVLLAAIRARGGARAVSAYLDRQDASGFAAVHRAMQENDRDTLVWLLRQGASPLLMTTLPDREPSPQALTLEMRNGYLPDVVLQVRDGLQQLLGRPLLAEPPATVSQREVGEPVITRWSLMHMAAKACLSDMETYRLLAQNRKLLVAEASDHSTPLQLYIRCSEMPIPIVRQLLTDIRGSAGETTFKRILETPEPHTELTPLRVAVRQGQLELVKLLLANGVSAQGRVTDTSPLRDAIELGQVDIAKSLLSAGANVNRLEAGNPPLVAAVQSGNEALVTLLLKHGAAVSPVKADVQPLAVALGSRHFGIARQLLARGADINRPSNDVRPLHVAFEANDAELVEFLLANGANPNLLSKGETPLHLAARSGQHDRLQTLLARGGNLATRNAAGETVQALRDARLAQERQWFAKGIDSAASCIASNNYDCAERHLKDIASYAHDDRARGLLRDAHSHFEQSRERYRRLVAAQEAEERRQQKARESEQALRFINASVALGGIAMSSRYQDAATTNRQIDSWVQDIGSGDANMSRFKATLADMQRENEAMQRALVARSAEHMEAQRARREQAQREDTERMAGEARAAVAEQQQAALVAKEKARQQQEAAREQARIAREEAARRQQAEREAEVERQKQAEARAWKEYYGRLRSQLSLGAISCPGDNGYHTIAGSRPSVSMPAAIKQYSSGYCVNYTAHCRRDPYGQSVSGRINHYAGGSNCYSADGARLDAQLACDANEVVVTVTQVEGCR